MRLHAPIVVAAFALLAAPACGPVRAETPWGQPDGYADEQPYDPEEAPDPEDYRAQLGGYGDWYDDPSYGPVWRPAAVPGWQPYVDGYWAWTSYGWTWISYEPWAWTLHYGRWMLLPAQGWVWLPGTVWGPAWVDWYWGDGYVGWAPLSPFATHVAVINNFVFVSEGDFCSRSLRRHVLHHHHVSDRVRRDWGRHDHRAPRRERIERVSRDGVTRLSGRPDGTLAPRRARRLGRPEARPDLTGARRTDGRAGARPRREDGRDDREARAAVPPSWRAGEAAARVDREPRIREPRAPEPRRREARPRVREPGFDGDDRSAPRPGGAARHTSSVAAPRLVAPPPRSGGTRPDARRSSGDRGDRGGADSRARASSGGIGPR